MSNQPVAPSSALAPNVAGALAYLLGPVTGIFFLVTEKQSRFVRFHAAQSVALSVVWVVLSVALTVLSSAVAAVPVIGWMIGLMLSLGLGLGFFALWLVLMYRAFQGHEWEVPGVGIYARRLLSAPAVR